MSVCAAAYPADEVWSHVRGVAELATHLQVADAADGVPELGQGLGAGQQQRGVGSDVVKLEDDVRRIQYFRRDNKMGDRHNSSEAKKL